MPHPKALLVRHLVGRGRAGCQAAIDPAPIFIVRRLLHLTTPVRPKSLHSDVTAQLVTGSIAVVSLEGVRLRWTSADGSRRAGIDPFLANSGSIVLRQLPDPILYSYVSALC